MSTGISVYTRVNLSTLYLNTDTGTLDEYRLITACAQPDCKLIQIPKHQMSFQPPHKKNRRGKFKRSGRG